MINRWQKIHGDVTGGLTAAVVALPLALAFGIASGAGPLAGLYGSIFGGLVAAIFGGCGVQITGPTGAMTAVLVSIISQHGIGGMLLAGALAGLMQITFGALRLGRFVKYLPQPVIAGFTNGVSILFFLTAVDDALGTISITLITAAVIVLALRYLKKVPESLFGLAAGLLVNELFIHSPHVVGSVNFKLPGLALGSMPFDRILHLLMPAFTISLLGSISALLSAEVTDEMLGTKSSSNRELIGQGLGNLVSALIGGVPVSGAVARSGVNVHSGGRTKLSSIFHAVFLLLMILLLSPIVTRIPLASLAAILMVASVRTADWKSIRRIPKARWSYGAIIVLTTVLTVVKDLTFAVLVGVIATGAIALWEMRRQSGRRSLTFAGTVNQTESEHPDIEVISFSGPLFFTGMEGLRRHIKETTKYIVVCDFSNVTVIDESGALALKKLILSLRAQDRVIYLAGLNQQPKKILTQLRIVADVTQEFIFEHVESAVASAQEYAFLSAGGDSQSQPLEIA